MRWYEKTEHEFNGTGVDVEPAFIYGLEVEGEVLVKYAGWREIEPDEVADAIYDSEFCPDNNSDWETDLQNFCNDMSGYVEEWCERVSMHAQSSDYAQGYQFYEDVAEEIRRKLEQNDLIERVWRPAQKGE